MSTTKQATPSLKSAKAAAKAPSPALVIDGKTGEMRVVTKSKPAATNEARRRAEAKKNVLSAASNGLEDLLGLPPLKGNRTAKERKADEQREAEELLREEKAATKAGGALAQVATVVVKAKKPAAKKAKPATTEEGTTPTDEKVYQSAEDAAVAALKAQRTRAAVFQQVPGTFRVCSKRTGTKAGWMFMGRVARLAKTTA